MKILILVSILSISIFNQTVEDSKKIIRQCKIDRDSISKINWNYVKENFYVVNKGSVLSSIIIKSAYAVNESNFNNFEKFINKSGLVQ